MKNPLLIGIAGVTLIALTATTIYAQVANTSIVDRMKAAVHAFTLSSDLNAGQTGYESAPVSGKKTGNMLTAAEWNRMLEIISQGTVGSGGGTTALYKCTNAQSLDPMNAPCYGASRNGGAGTDQYRVVSCSNTDASGTYTAGGVLNFGDFIANKWSFHINDSNIACIDGTILVMDIQSGGSTTGGGDKFTFVDSDIRLFSSGVTKTDRTTPVALDISTIAGVTIPANAKAVQLYVYCANYTNQNEGVGLSLGRSVATTLRACAQNVFGAANDVDTNTVIVPLADDKKTIYYSYTVPSTENGGQVAFYLRGFITE